MTKDFEVIPHTADIKIRVYGQTKEELFCNALRGMFTVIGPHVPGCKKENDRILCSQLPRIHTIEVDAPDCDALLVNFLSDALYHSDINDEAYFDAEIHEFSDMHLYATIKGVAVTGFDVVEIKAVTYHDLHIEYQDGMWQTDIIFDI